MAYTPKNSTIVSNNTGLMKYRLIDFGGNWEVYKSYLAAYGHLGQNLDHGHHDWQAYLKASGKPT